MKKPNVLKVFHQKSLQFFDAIQHLIYPNVCIICQKEVQNRTDIVCPFCQIDFNYTYFESYEIPTVLDKLFWGRAKIYKTYALLFFEKHKDAQPILHALKYQSRKEVGTQLGRIIGKKIETHYTNLDALIPVPIHPKKKFLRGYNQSEMIAKGISQILGVPVINNCVSKQENTMSQTKMGKNLRWENVQNQFDWNKKKLEKYKHIAIVDDVITTGATIESMVKSILIEVADIRISVISLALTK